MVAGRPKYWTEERVLELGERMLAWFEADKANMFMLEFLSDNGVHSQRISEWTGFYPKFAETVKRCKEMQENRLQRHLTSGKNPVGAIFLLKNLHNYVDRKDIVSQSTSKVEVTHKDEVKKLEPDEVRELIRNQVEPQKASKN